MQQEMMSVVCWMLFYVSKVFIINHMCAIATIEVSINRGLKKNLNMSIIRIQRTAKILHLGNLKFRDP